MSNRQMFCTYFQIDGISDGVGLTEKSIPSIWEGVENLLGAVMVEVTGLSIGVTATTGVICLKDWKYCIQRMSTAIV